MTVSSSQNQIQAFGDGVSKTFPIPFYFLESSDIVVVVSSPGPLGIPVTLTPNIDYTVSGAGNQSGGSVTLTAAPANTYTVTITRYVTATQLTDYQENDDFPASSHERALDKLTMLVQQVSTDSSLALKRSTGSPFYNAEGRRISNVGDPILDADAATKKWAQQYVGSILSTGQGPMNLAANVAYVTPTGTVSNVQQLSGSSGPSLIGDGLGSLGQSLGGFIPMSRFGAFGTGADESAQVRAAVSAAMASGIPLDGLGKTYSVSGNIEASGNFTLINASFIQLNPDAVDRRTIFYSGGSKCHLSVKVNRNGSGTGGQMGNSAGIYVANCADARLDECEVTGNNFGDGIIVTDSIVKLYNNYVHDMSYGSPSTPAQTDDVMQGIFLARCTGERIGNRVERLRGQWSGRSLINRFTRGFALSGCYDMMALGDISDTVDQCFDYSGGENNRRISTTSCHAKNAYTWGFKAANTVTDCQYTACIAFRCAMGSFTASAPGGDIGVSTSILTQNITYTSCKGIENGMQTAADGTAVAGPHSANGQCNTFSALNSTFYSTWPQGIKWINCQSVGGIPRYGFRNDVGVVAANRFWNEAIYCESRDHTVGAFTGINAGAFARNSLSTQSIPNASATVVSMPNIRYDMMAADNGGNVLIKRSGVYSLSAAVTFAGAATGTRTLNILVNGGAIPGGRDIKPGNAQGTTNNLGGVPYKLVAGDNIRLEVTQDSGGSLNISDAFLSVTETSNGQMT